VVGLVDSFKTLPDKRGLYAPNAGFPVLPGSARKSAPRLVAINGGR
jgi:hypothetical protein